MRRLTQMGAASALAIVMVGIPAVPSVLAGLLSSSEWDAQAANASADLATDDGVEVVTAPPAGWDVLDEGDRLAFRSGDAVVLVDVYDRAGRDVDAMAERLLRLDRMRGINAARDGGQAANGDGTLRGPTCVVTTRVSTGTCAVVADDDVVVYVRTLGSPAQPALPLTEALESVRRGQP